MKTKQCFEHETYIKRWHVIHFLFVILAFLFLIPEKAFCQEENKTVPDGTEGDALIVPPKDTLNGKKKSLTWNEFDLGFSTIKLGLGYIHDYATFSQDEVAKEQMELAGVEAKAGFNVRDFRFLSSGKLNTKRTIAWKASLMYDGVTEEWYVRETGFTIGAPELAGHLFIGRTKEGFSLNKVLNGHAGWTMERQMALDVIPILGDGIKWFGFLPKQRLFWNIGAFTDWTSRKQGFSTFQWQYVARIGWMPFYFKENNKLLHIGVNLRYGKPDDGNIRLRSKPESNIAPYFIDTGEFNSDHSNHIGGEVYYSNGNLMINSEFYLHSFSSDESNDPKFFGGDIALCYIVTGESRPYNTAGSIFGFVPVRKSILEGGAGAWEAVLHLSTFDLDSGPIQGGKFWRITPVVNWYPVKGLRFELSYGYGVLNRFNLKGTTQFFQTRIQLSIM